MKFYLQWSLSRDSYWGIDFLTCISLLQFVDSDSQITPRVWVILSQSYCNRKMYTVVNIRPPGCMCVPWWFHQVSALCSALTFLLSQLSIKHPGWGYCALLVLSVLFFSFMQVPAVHCMYGNVSVYFVMHVELHTLSFWPTVRSGHCHRKSVRPSVTLVDCGQTA